MKRLAQQGFTFIELIMVIVIVTLATLPILGQFTQAGNSLLANEEIQTAAQLAQGRAEEILAIRRVQGYDAIATGTINDVLTGNFAANTRTVTVSSPPAGSGCAAGASCKEVIVSVSHAGNPRAEVTFMLVDY